MFYTYILQSKKDGKLYTGSTKNLQYFTGSTTIYPVLKKALIIVFLFTIYCLLSTSHASAATIARPMHNSGLVGYWSFEEGKGNSKTFDRSGRGNTGTLTNMDPLTDWVNGATSTGQALDFDGVDDLVNAGSGASLDDLASYTVSAWIRPESLGDSSFGRIVDKDNGNANGWLFFVCTSGVAPTCTSSLRLNHDFTGTDGSWSSANNSITLNQWQHVAVTYSPSATTNDPIFYINGVVSAISSENTPTLSDDTDGVNNLRIGDRSALDRSFDGQIDEVRIYNRILSADEITRLYNLKKPKVVSGINNTGLVAYWPLDEGTGTRVEDASFNTNTGTTTNMADTDWITGRVGKALYFDGVNNYMSAPSSADLNIGTSNVTFSAWIKPPNAVGSFRRAIFTKRDPVTFQQYAFGTGYVDAAGSGVAGKQIGCFFYNGGPGLNTTTAQSYRTTNDVVDGNWHFVQCVRQNGSAVKFYVDGVSVPVTAIIAGTTNVNSDNTNPLYVGTGTAVVFMENTLDELRIYKRALSATEIYNLYEGSRATVVNKTRTDKLTNGLVGHWTFDGKDIYGTTALDKTSNNNRGTLTNGPTPVIGKVGQALIFDGSDDSVSMGDVIMDSLTTVSVCAWVKHDTITSDDDILGKQNGPVEGIVFFRDDVGAVSARTDIYSVYINETAAAGNTSARLESASNTALANTWNHVCMTLTLNDSSGLNMYINGVKTPDSPLTTSGIDNIDGGTTALTVGSPRYFDGQIDEVRIYNRALSADEVYQLYNMGR